MTYKCMGDTETSEAVVIASGYITVNRFSEKSSKIEDESESLNNSDVHAVAEEK